MNKNCECEKGRGKLPRRWGNQPVTKWKRNEIQTQIKFYFVSLSEYQQCSDFFLWTTWIFLEIDKFFENRSSAALSLLHSLSAVLLCSYFSHEFPLSHHYFFFFYLWFLSPHTQNHNSSTFCRRIGSISKFFMHLSLFINFVKS